MIEFQRDRISARLHYKSTLAKDRHHKLELLGAGKLGYSQMVKEVAKVTNATAETLKIMRLDCAVDLPDIATEWFRGSVSNLGTKVFAEFRSTFFSSQISTTGLTLQFGRRPDCIRIYDKAAELRRRYTSDKYKSSSISSFQHCHSIDPHLVLTRVERQYVRRLPKPIRTLADLPNVVHVHPFATLIFRAAGEPTKLPAGCTLTEWITGTWLCNSIDVHGYHCTRQFVNRWGKNFSQMERRYREFLKIEKPPDLDDLFVRGVREQLAL